MSLFASLRPQEYVTSIYHIHLDRLWQAGIRGIVTDLDNTLVEWNSPVAPPKLVAWLDHVREQGFRVCIVSNNDQLRVSQFAGPLGIASLSKAHKPRRDAFLWALRTLSTKAGETCMIGDQLFTDILGGNRLGFYTILVRPVHVREFPGTRAVRLLERIVLRKVQLQPAGEYFHYTEAEAANRHNGEVPG